MSDSIRFFRSPGCGEESKSDADDLCVCVCWKKNNENEKLKICHLDRELQLVVEL